MGEGAESGEGVKWLPLNKNGREKGESVKADTDVGDACQVTVLQVMGNLDGGSEAGREGKVGEGKALLIEVVDAISVEVSVRVGQDTLDGVGPEGERVDGVPADDQP